MEMGSYGWERNAKASVYTDGGVGGSAHSLKIVGDPADSIESRAHQDVDINLPSSETYVLSGWVKANAVPDNVTTAESEKTDTSKQCGLRAAVYFTDGTKEIFYEPFNPDLTDWQFLSLAIVPTKADKTVDHIRVILTYEGNANTAYFDNISLALL